ncbi:MAG: repeat-containing protein [Gammaproteobacteria bacterium]|nr:repeat-containing protein [Gammaproteobacteria bacterium]
MIRRGAVRHGDPWAAAIRRGDLDTAWRISDAVLAQRNAAETDCSAWPRHLQFVWNGSPFDRRHVLVRCYHGLGDTIQFVRFLSKLRARAARVSLWVQPALIELLRSVAGIDALLPLHDGVPDVEYDVDMELMEVPHSLRVTSRDLSTRHPYISVPAGPSEQFDEGLRIGLIWKAGTWDWKRSLPAERLAPLRQIPNVRWYSLQYPYEAPPFLLESLASENVVQMACHMRNLDLIISVDTMAAHLAGALGVPVWTLLPYESDWRWFDHPARSVWYPTMRLFRQPFPHAWTALVREIESRLGAIMGARARLPLRD